MVTCASIRSPVAIDDGAVTVMLVLLDAVCVEQPAFTLGYGPGHVPMSAIGSMMY